MGSSNSQPKASTTTPTTGVHWTQNDPRFQSRNVIASSSRSPQPRVENVVRSSVYSHSQPSQPSRSSYVSPSSVNSSSNSHSQPSQPYKPSYVPQTSSSSSVNSTSNSHSQPSQPYKPSYVPQTSSSSSVNSTSNSHSQPSQPYKPSYVPQTSSSSSVNSTSNSHSQSSQPYKPSYVPQTSSSSSVNSTSNSHSQPSQPYKPTSAPIKPLYRDSSSSVTSSNHASHSTCTGLTSNSFHNVKDSFSPQKQTVRQEIEKNPGMMPSSPGQKENFQNTAKHSNFQGSNNKQFQGRTRRNRGRDRNRNHQPKKFNENDAEDVESSTTKHDAFLKKLIGTFKLSHDKTKGMYCAACDQYELFVGRKPLIGHTQKDDHREKAYNYPNFERIFCRSCKAIFYCNKHFFISHKQSELHTFIADLKPTRVEEVVDELDSDNTLNLKKEIKQHFRQRLNACLDNVDYSFYCHKCQQWFTDLDEWTTHHELHTHDKNVQRTFKNCSRCQVMMCGSSLLSAFHDDALQHDKFLEFLNLPDSSESNDDDDDDRLSTTSRPESTFGDKTYIVLKDLPSNTSRHDIFKFFKDFGNLKTWEMNAIGENSAVVQFKFGSVAENLINSKLPIFINGKKVIALLQRF